MRPTLVLAFAAMVAGAPLLGACAPAGGSATAETAGGRSYEAPATGSLLSGGNHDSLSNGNLDAGMSQRTNGTSSH